MYKPCGKYTLCGINPVFTRLFRSMGQVTHALLTRPPLSSLKITPKGSIKRFSLDLHVLGTPPAFVLSQDQTLNKKYFSSPSGEVKIFHQVICDSITQIRFVLRRTLRIYCVLKNENRFAGYAIQFSMFDVSRQAT